MFRGCFENAWSHLYYLHLRLHTIYCSLFLFQGCALTLVWHMDRIQIHWTGSKDWSIHLWSAPPLYEHFIRICWVKRGLTNCNCRRGQYIMVDLMPCFAMPVSATINVMFGRLVYSVEGVVKRAPTMILPSKGVWNDQGTWIQHVSKCKCTYINLSNKRQCIYKLTVIWPNPFKCCYYCRL